MELVKSVGVVVGEGWQLVVSGWALDLDGSWSGSWAMACASYAGAGKGAGHGWAGE